ncbi:brain-enriched guanylate kinase-associated protein [Salminus brasiliensis]|uniref:brain-enriched guanylate kinase-associated protein n=1 Tax=Salminus brasiliensis TaxID=930266 RepID=UPI003B837E14
MQDQKENLQKHLSHTTHKLEMLESEFDTTRQNLEKELQQAQEELDKFIDKLHRIQSSYAALQRINQDLQDKIHRKTQLYEEEKRTLNQEIIKLNNHLMEANITIEKLRNDNDLYRKDCNLAAQLLQCGKSQHRVHKVSELPTDFQERVSSHIEKHGHSRRKNLCLSPSSDMVPTAIIAKVLEKPEAGNSCSVTCSPSPQSRDADFLTNNGVDTGDTLHRSVVYKSSDLYFSDTALYCPVVDRHQDHWNRRPQSVDLHCRDADLLQAQNSTDSNPEVDNLQPSFSNNDVPMYEFSAGSPAPSSSYSSISVASDEKGHAPNSTLSSPRALCVDWQAGVYEQKSTSNSHHKNSPGFPMLHSFQHMPPSPPKCNSPLYMRTASYSEPYQSPQLTSSHSIGYSGVPRETRIHIPEVGMTGGWRQLSMEDINTLPYYSAGHVSPYSFSKQHFTKGPSTIKQGPLYSSSLSQVRDNVFHTHNRVKNVKKEYTGISPNFSEKLQQNQQEVSNVQQYQLQSPLPQKKIPHHHQTFGSIGLSRKDSLNKAQLYGTLLN